jgi:DNA polymerase-3 subunit delta
MISASGVPGEAVRSRDASSTTWRELHDDLASRSLFDDDGARVVVVNEADDFVSKNRPSLEKWVEGPSPQAFLILRVQTFPATTKLYKGVAASGLIVKCSPPIKARTKDTIDDKAVGEWLIAWGSKKHGVKLSDQQATLMVERIGAIFGLLDTELAKLALFADEQGQVSDAIVRELVGGWRTKTIWEIADQIAAGNASFALEQLDRLFASGQNAFAIMAQLSWYFRRFGLAAHLIEQAELSNAKPSLSQALEQAGFNFYAVKDAEKNLRRIGRQRAKLLLGWLKQIDLKMKGSHSTDSKGRMAIEEFIAKLAS